MPSCSIDERNGKYRLRWRQHGRARSHTVTSKRRAKQLQGDCIDALEKYGKWEPPSARGQPQRVGSLTDLTRAFIVASSSHFAPKSLRLYAMHLDLFHRWAADAKVPDAPASLTSGLLREFYVALKLGTVPGADGAAGKPRAEVTAAKYVQTVQNAWAWAFGSDEVDALVPPPRTIKLPRSMPRRTVAPTWEESGAVVLTARGARQRLAWVLYATGLRVDQAMRLLWDDVDMDDETLRIRPELGKTAAERRGRVVPLAPVLVAELAGWGAREGWLLPDIAAGKRPREARAREMGKLWRDAGVREEAWKQRPQHAFRKCFRSRLKQLGADSEAVEFLIGHSQGLVDTYQDPDALPLREAVALVPHPSGGAVTLLRRAK